MQRDFSRAIVHLFTGKEGKTPYVVSDVLAELKKRYKKVNLLHISSHPLHLCIEIDDTPIYIWSTTTTSTEQTPDEMIFYATVPDAFGVVRFDVLRRINYVPSSIMDDPTIVNNMNFIRGDWLQNWPKVSDLLWSNLRQKYRVEGKKAELPISYVSEYAFVEAIQLVLNSLKWNV